MLDEGKVHLLATDAHDTKRGPPFLAEARESVARRLGKDEADRLVVKNPLCILQNVIPSGLPHFAGKGSGDDGGFWRWARGLGRG
jgi:protein-tyrosine phosphatase